MIEIIPNIHPILVHFSIALTSTCFIFLCLGYIAKKLDRQKLSDKIFFTAEWLLYLLGMFIVLTILAGIYAFYTVNTHDMLSHNAMLLHRNVAIIFGISVFISIVWAIKLSINKVFPSIYFIIGFIVPVILSLATGYLGAELVFRYSIGVIKENVSITYEDADTNNGHMSSSVMQGSGHQH